MDATIAVATREGSRRMLDILSDPSAMQDIRDAAHAIATGDVVTADELRAKYLTR